MPAVKRCWQSGRTDLRVTLVSNIQMISSSSAGDHHAAGAVQDGHDAADGQQVLQRVQQAHVLAWTWFQGFRHGMSFLDAGLICVNRDLLQRTRLTRSGVSSLQGPACPAWCAAWSAQRIAIEVLLGSVQSRAAVPPDGRRR